MNDDNTKVCKGCGKRRPKKLFYKRSCNKDGLGIYCKPCVSERTKAYWEKTGGRKRYDQESSKTNYARNRDKLKERARIWRKNNPEKAQEAARKSREKRKEIIKENYRNTQENNPEFYRERDNRRRSRKLGAEGYHTPQDIKDQLESQEFLCFFCSEELVGEDGKLKYHLDHLIPLSREGTNWPENLACACPTCNLKKHNKMPWELFGWIPFIFACQRMKKPTLLD